MKKFLNQAGSLSLHMLFIGTIGTVIMLGFVLWADGYVRNTSRDVTASKAFTIAESGIEYYRWHLAHAPQDYQDGTGEPGPYIHPYYDRNGTRVGEFQLEITPPVEDNSIVTIRSTGIVDADPTNPKIIEVKMALPSLVRFSVAANADIRFGAGTEIYGQLHSNGGIRFDGVAHNVVSSAKEDYNDPDHSGGNEFGVHTHVAPTDPLPPAAVPVRQDVFKVGRQFPVPAIDFAGFAQDLADLKTTAQGPNGYYRGPSNRSGWLIRLKTNDTFDLYKVRRVRRAPWGCWSNQAYWGTWSYQSNRLQLIATNVPFPSSGVMFFEDHLWVEGTIDGARLTIAAGAFPINPSTYKHMTINNDLRYTNYDGTDLLGLIAQGNQNVGLYSQNNLEIDAVLMAQNGRVGRHYYGWWCGGNSTRNKVELYGSIISNQRYGWAYTDGTGYATRVITYDGNLLYGPPPGFPVTATQYDILSWEEIE